MRFVISLAASLLVNTAWAEEVVLNCKYEDVIVWQESTTPTGGFSLIITMLPDGHITATSTACTSFKGRYRDLEFSMYCQSGDHEVIYIDRIEGSFQEMYSMKGLFFLYSGHCRLAKPQF